MMRKGDFERDDPCTPTSSSLSDRVKIRAPGAWEQFVDVYAPVIYRWCRRTGVDADDAPDLVQEVFLAVATHIGDFHSDRPGDTFRGWLWTITHNKICDHIRSQNKEAKARGGSKAAERMSSIPDRLPSIPHASPHSNDETRMARRVLKLIRPVMADRTWQAFWRLAVDGRSGSDVAAELGMSLRAVYQAKYRVLKRVREALDSQMAQQNLNGSLSVLGFGKIAAKQQ